MEALDYFFINSSLLTYTSKNVNKFHIIQAMTVKKKIKGELIIIKETSNCLHLCNQQC